MSKQLPFTIDWRADGGDWRTIAAFAARGDAETFAAELAARPATGAVQIIHKGGKIIRDLDVYAIQERARIERRNASAVDQFSSMLRLMMPGGPS